jgi:hypothetical protein
VGKVVKHHTNFSAKENEAEKGKTDSESNLKNFIF